MKSPLEPDPAETGLPGITRWRSVYIMVLAFTEAWIVFLFWLTEKYS